jgi:hypothetical protein
MPIDRIETTFHETFALNLPAVVSVLQVCEEHDGQVTPDILSAEIPLLGPNYIKAMPRYARGCGLLAMGGFTLTPFGKAVLLNDPSLERLSTLWLMHYHLSAPRGPGPAFWNRVITGTMRIGQAITRPIVVEAIADFKREMSEKSLSSRTVESTATVFLGTYSKSDALGKLGILTAVEEGKGIYAVRQPEPPPLWALAYALWAYWDSCSPGSTELLLRDLGRADGLAGLFLMGPGMLGTLLGELQAAGLLMIKRDAPPFVVTRLSQDSQEILARMYA